jgi:hypothetical protein
MRLWWVSTDKWFAAIPGATREAFELIDGTHGDDQSTESRSRAIPRTSIPRSPDQAIAAAGSEYAIPSIEWHHYNTLYQLLDYANDWPEGLVAHAAWQSGGEGHALYFWDERKSMDVYYATVAADRIAQAINLTGTVRDSTGNAADVQAQPLDVLDFVFGPLARRFCDIGADFDGSAINRLGQPPAVIQIEIEGFDKELSAQLSAALDFGSNIPRGLIARATYERNGTWCVFEIWSDREKASDAFELIEFPAIHKLGEARGVELRVEHSSDQPSRVVFGPDAVGAFGF